MKLDQCVKEGMTRAQYGELTTEKQHVIGAIDGDLENGFINSGQIAGLIDHIPSVKELIENMINDARNQINKSKKDLDFIVERFNIK